MRRRSFLLAAAGAACLLVRSALAAGAETVRGRLVQKERQPPAVETSPGRLVALEGSPDTIAVLKDSRLAGADMEFTGRLKGTEHFEIGPFHRPESMIVHKDGKKYTISYWCQTCAIRTYTPGKCMCCQEETELSLQEYQPR